MLQNIIHSSSCWSKNVQKSTHAAFLLRLDIMNVMVNCRVHSRSNTTPVSLHMFVVPSWGHCQVLGVSRCSCSHVPRLIILIAIDMCSASAFVDYCSAFVDYCSVQFSAECQLATAVQCCCTSSMHSVHKVHVYVLWDSSYMYFRVTLHLLQCVIKDLHVYTLVGGASVVYSSWFVCVCVWKTLTKARRWIVCRARHFLLRWKGQGESAVRKGSSIGHYWSEVN